MSDAGALADTLGTLYDTVIEPGNWPLALEKVTAFVGGSGALLFHQDRRLGTGDFFHSYNADHHYTELYFQKYVALNPVLPYTALMEPGSCASFSQFIDAGEYTASRFYLEWAAPQRLVDVVVALLEKSGSAMGMLGVSRTSDQGYATKAELDRMELVAPHVRRAVAIARRFEFLATGAAGLATALEALADGVVFLDAAGTVLFANDPARDMMKSGRAIGQVGATLSVVDRDAARSLRDAIKAAAEGDVADRRLVSDIVLLTEGTERLIGQLLPLARGKRRNVGPLRAVAALFLRRVGVDAPLPAEQLIRTFGLTPREWQVFQGIVQFGGVPDVADIYGIAPATVRSHLQKIFDKTGVRRQADLARLAQSLSLPLGNGG